ncbi:Ribosomal protein [Trema orientale]|uniref:Ribosomal protein n=1 Tax=Trema orientale TaxID=63057 RepID=A0A2P5FKA8_TREOI|nr:Ribosomal protein [Trema orientale]
MTKPQPFSWARLLLKQALKKPPKPTSPFSRESSIFRHFPVSQTPKLSFLGKTRYSTLSSRVVEDLLAELEKDRQREREQRKRAGLDTKDIDEEENEDYLGLTPIIEKLEKEKLKNVGDLNKYEEATDSDSDEDDERFTPEAIKKRNDEFQRKFKRHQELLKNFTDAETLDDAYKWMNKIDKFEQKHFQLRPEYRVIGELMNRLKVAEGKDKFILQHKLNRAMRLVEWKEAYDPNSPANYGIIQHQQAGPYADHLEKAETEKEEQSVEAVADDDDDDDEEEFDDMKEKDDILLEKLNAIDKKLEEKLADLDHTFGKKGKLLEEEIRNLAEERNALTEKKRKPLYRKGFDVKLIDVNRTCKVTKGGQVVKYAAILACGNYHGVVGYAKAKGPAVPIALQKAYEKCFQNLHYIERHEEHTIAHAVQTSYKKTKVYLWPAPTRTGMKAGRTVQTILNLAGFKNVKSKVVGSRNPHNTVKAVFKALNAIETPKDVQEKFGRTVVEKYLL